MLISNFVFGYGMSKFSNFNLKFSIQYDLILKYCMLFIHSTLKNIGSLINKSSSKILFFLKHYANCNLFSMLR
ncbi:hypothetical protein FGO68_gene12486 [Halteria grandinella]|uniref:Uncharacterized protein n=1 Tax=Halteria grandinella TaxID=5974 RepID=A0A8J8NF73_HALGN|nr:hypothetical protein FGO68_gene12486 [Halteria grandinella]